MTWAGSKIRRLANQVIGRYGTVCWLCGQPIDMQASRRAPLGLSIDHVIPRSKGGSDDIDNLRPAHLQCNCKRQDKPAAALRSRRAWSGSGQWPGLSAPSR